MLRLEKNGLHVEAAGIPRRCLEAALDAAIEALGDADRQESAQGAFDFEAADDLGCRNWAMQLNDNLGAITLCIG